MGCERGRLFLLPWETYGVETERKSAIGLWTSFLIVIIFTIGISANESIYCGNTKPATEIVHSDRIEVTFISDDTVQRKGFVLTYMLSKSYLQVTYLIERKFQYVM